MTPEMSAKPSSTDAFHGHLDICERCRCNPFDLCAVGDRLLMETVSVPSPKPEAGGKQ